MYAFLSTVGQKLWGFIVRAIEEDIEFEEFYSEISKNYPEYDEFHARLDYLRTEQQLRWWSEMRNIPEEYAPSRDYYALSAKPTAKRYYMTFEVYGFNKKTMQFETRYTTIGKNYISTLKEFYNDVKKQFQRSSEKEENPSDDFEIISITPVKAWRGW